MKGIYKIMVAMVLSLAFLSYQGCVAYWGYGEVKPAHKDSPNIKDLMENWQDYHVRFSGLSIDNPSGLMFDPKRDQKELTGKYWRPVTERATLERIVMWLEAKGSSQPRLLRIIGPDRILYGYVYTGRTQVVSRAVDEQTMWVMDLSTIEPKSPGGSSAP